ncbi:hypothetical protein ACOSP7_030027 [Xanthoceras sorbifolium]
MQTYFGAYAAKMHSSIWHAKLGHPAPLVLKKILQQLHVPCNIETLEFIDSCKLGNVHRLPFTRSQISTKEPLELVYSDIWGPAPFVSTQGFRYYIAFVDAFTRFTWMFPLKLKSDALGVFITFQKYVELQLGKMIKYLQTDMGREFLPFVPFLSKQGVKVRFSCAYTHAQNGVVERKHRHLVETRLTLLAHARMPLTFWLEAFTTACFLVNNMPTALLQFKSPFEVLHKEAPNYNFLHTFGCSVFPYLRDYSKIKLNFQTTKCVFIGYSTMHKGYCCLHPSRKVFVTRHAEFNEREFPYTSIFPCTNSTSGSVLVQVPSKYY